MTFDQWFRRNVVEFYSSGKNFSDEECFPLQCVYRWTRGVCLPRPIQISIICKIISKKIYSNQEYDSVIAYEIIYSGVCADVMEMLQKDSPKKINRKV
jgi:hypothetical protein